MNGHAYCSNTNLQFLCECPIRQSNHHVGKVTPVRATSCGYVGYSSLNKWSHVLADVISQYGLTLVPPHLYKSNIKIHTCIYGQKNRKFHRQSVAKTRAHQSLKMWHGFSTISHLLPLVSITYLWKVGHSISNCDCSQGCRHCPSAAWHKLKWRKLQQLDYK